MSRNTLVINCDLRETRVCLIEDGVIAELHLERTLHRGTVGNIVLGRVTRVLPGMQAAFIDIGMERAAFLHVEDLIRPDDFESYLDKGDRREEEPSGKGDGSRRFHGASGDSAEDDLTDSDAEWEPNADEAALPDDATAKRPAGAVKRPATMRPAARTTDAVSGPTAVQRVVSPGRGIAREASEVACAQAVATAADSAAVTSEAGDTLGSNLSEATALAAAGSAMGAAADPRPEAEDLVGEPGTEAFLADHLDDDVGDTEASEADDFVDQPDAESAESDEGDDEDADDEDADDEDAEDEDA
ncbi:MAG TPA: hypothetical protein VIV60_03005, partial [Polyangiaceae bacterium]